MASLTSKQSSTNKTLNCSLCHQLLIEPLVTPCGHSFCRQCLLHHAQLNAVCPVDGRDLGSTSDLVISKPLQAMIAEKEPTLLNARLAQTSSHTSLLVDALGTDDVTVAVTPSTSAPIDSSDVTASAPSPSLGDRQDSTSGADTTPQVSQAHEDLMDAMQANLTDLESTVVDSMRALLFSDKSTFLEHYQAQQAHYDVYVCVLYTAMQRRIAMSHGSQSRCLAAALSRKDKALVEYLLSDASRGLLSEDRGYADRFGLPDLLNAVKLLDAGRLLRQKQHRLDHLMAAGCKKKKQMSQLRNDIETLQREEVEGSLSGATCRYLISLLKKIPAGKLKYFALQMPSEPWRQLVDLLHLNPKDLQLDWFMAKTYNEPLPEGCIVTTIGDINQHNAVDLMLEHKPSYSFLRTKVDQVTDEMRLALVGYASLDQCLWWYHELHCKGVDEILVKRLAEPQALESIGLSYGKLMERLLYIKLKHRRSPLLPILLPVADRKLSALDLTLSPPVAVIGDASSSMNVAIRTAVIMSSVVAALADASLDFFNGSNFKPQFQPQNAEQVLELAVKTKASGCTSPAASLWRFYKEKKVVNHFVIVTDEEENTNCQGYDFTKLMKLYLKEVNPAAKIFFISFLPTNGKGEMVEKLRKAGVPCEQFRLAAGQPDLSKLDSVLGQMSLSN
eukprot:m.236059 g.236059  ORF g.236059 m.236059 type:complete len:673 (+) comp17411_c0_seq3:1497-3515(+)